MQPLPIDPLVDMAFRVARHTASKKRCYYRLDPDEAESACMYGVARALEKIDSSRNPFSYFISACCNAMKNERNRKRRIFYYENGYRNGKPSQCEQSYDFIDHEIKSEIHPIVWRRIVEEMSWTDIAAIQNMTVNGCLKRYSREIAKTRKEMGVITTVSKGKKRFYRSIGELHADRESIPLGS